MLRQWAVLAGVLLVAVAALGVLFVLGMRAKSKLVLKPLFWLLRTIINPLQLRSAGTPGAAASIVRHRGRKTGRPYETPVVAVAAGDGFVIALPYGSRAQWHKNVVASGSAIVVNDGHTYRVDQPKIIPMRAAEAYFTASDQRTHRRFGVDQCLRVRRAGLEGAGEHV